MKVDWRSAAVYAILTAIALGLLYAFVGFVADRVHVISWTLLIAGVAGSSALLVYLVLRWYGGRTLERLGAPLDRAINRLRSPKSHDDINRPLTVKDLQATAGDIGETIVGMRHYAGILLSTMLLMAVTLEIVALATAAVMYLQAERIDEQNKLLAAQNRGQDAAFLNESLTSIKTISETLDEVRQIENSISSDLLSPFGVVGDLVAAMTNETVKMENFRPLVCKGEPVHCDDFSTDSFAEIENDLVLTDANASPIRGYYRLSKAAEFTTLAFVSSIGDREDAVNVSIAQVGEIISNANVICGYSKAEHLNDLWTSISGMGLASMEMWPVDDVSKLMNGFKLNFAKHSDSISLSPADLGRANIMGLMAGIGALGQIVGDDTASLQGPKTAAALFGTAMINFRSELQSALTACEDERRLLSEQAAALRDRRDKIAKRLLEQKNEDNTRS
jgi:hypothetical protein